MSLIGGPGKLVEEKYRRHLPESKFLFLRHGQHSHYHEDCEFRMINGVVRLTVPRERLEQHFPGRSPHRWFYRQFSINPHPEGGWEAMGVRGKLSCPERVRARTLTEMRACLDMKIEHERTEAIRRCPRHIPMEDLGLVLYVGEEKRPVSFGEYMDMERSKMGLGDVVGGGERKSLAALTEEIQSAAKKFADANAALKAAEKARDEAKAAVIALHEEHGIEDFEIPGDPDENVVKVVTMPGRKGVDWDLLAEMTSKEVVDAVTKIGASYYSVKVGKKKAKKPRPPQPKPGRPAPGSDVVPY